MAIKVPLRKTFGDWWSDTRGVTCTCLASARPSLQTSTTKKKKNKERKRKQNMKCFCRETFFFSGKTPKHANQPLCGSKSLYNCTEKNVRD
jgi:hypothetical protein